MTGNQFGFSFKDNISISNLYTIFNDKLEEYMDSYNLTEDDVAYIQLSFRTVDKVLLSEFYLESPSHITTIENKITSSQLSIPVSVNKDSRGEPLPVNVLDGKITYIKLIINNKQVNYLDVIKDKAKLLKSGHIYNISSFENKYRFYKLKDKFDYVLAVK